MALPPFTLAAILSLLCIPLVYASPLNCTGTPTLNVNDSPSGSSHTRTLWDIIWSCAATLFACTWATIHPNIPGMDERKIAIFFRRLYTMIIALVAPELMVTWAMMQFLSARDTAKTFNVAFNHSESKAILSAPHDNFRGWTLAHGFSHGWADSCFTSMISRGLLLHPGNLNSS